MRAVYLPGYSLESGSVIEVSGERFHHLVNVTRLRVGSNVLVLRGDGVKAWAQVMQVEKRRLWLEIDEVRSEEDRRFLDLIVGVPKKEAFDEVLRVAAECGIRRIYPFLSEYAQKINFNEKRQKRVTESALIQSNNPFDLRVGPILESLDEVLSLVQDYQQTYLATMQETRLKDEKGAFSENQLLIIGPEGGFSPDEEGELLKVSRGIHLPSYILRTPHAVAGCFGWISQYKK